MIGRVFTSGNNISKFKQTAVLLHNVRYIIPYFSFFLSQREDFRIGLIWSKFGVSVAERAVELHETRLQTVCLSRENICSSSVKNELEVIIVRPAWTCYDRSIWLQTHLRSRTWWRRDLDAAEIYTYVEEKLIDY